MSASGQDHTAESRAREAEDASEFIANHGECPATTIARCLYVADLMTRGQWVRGETAADIAASWGLSKSRIEDYSTEASRWLKTLVDPEPVREKLAHRLHEALDDARGQPRSVAEVAKAYMPLVGIGDKGTTNQVYVDARTGAFAPPVAAAIVAIVEQAIAAALDAYELAPGDRDGASDAGVAAAGRRLTGSVGQLVGGGER